VRVCLVVVVAARRREGFVGSFVRGGAVCSVDDLDDVEIIDSGRGGRRVSTRVESGREDTPDAVEVFLVWERVVDPRVVSVGPLRRDCDR
jgi:hypothetical protein